MKRLFSDGGKSMELKASISRKYECLWQITQLVDLQRLAVSVFDF
jgi:hypothetical protein